MDSSNRKTRGCRFALRSQLAWYGASCRILAQTLSRSSPSMRIAVRELSRPPMFTRHCGRFINHEDHSGWFGRDQLVPTMYRSPSIAKYCNGTTTPSPRALVTRSVNEGIRETAVMVHRPPPIRYSRRSATTDDLRIGAARSWCPTASTARRITPTSPPRSCDVSADEFMLPSRIQTPEHCHDDSAQRVTRHTNRQHSVASRCVAQM